MTNALIKLEKVELTLASRAGSVPILRSIDLVLERLADSVIEGFNTLPRDQVEKLQVDFVKAHTPVIPKEAAAAVTAPVAAVEPPAEVDSNGETVAAAEAPAT